MLRGRDLRPRRRLVFAESSKAVVGEGLHQGLGRQGPGQGSWVRWRDMILPICVQFSPSPGGDLHASLVLAAWASSRRINSSVGTIQPLSRGASVPCPSSPAGCRPAWAWLALPTGTNNAPLWSGHMPGAGSAGHPDLSLAPGLGPARACGMIWHNPSGHFGDIPPPKETPQGDTVSHCPAVPGTEGIPGVMDFQC